jgi:glutathione peroxidase
MPKRLLLTIATTLSLPGCDNRIVTTATTHEHNPMPLAATGVYAHDITDLEGNATSLPAGHVTLIVNVASQCGYTPQYRDLQTLHDTYADRGFAVIGFPCNDFGSQEPGDAAAITACATGLDASFMLMDKVHVKAGPNQSPVYRDLSQATGVLPKWNFGKYLVNREGVAVAFFGSSVGPMDPELTGEIETLLDRPR